MIHSLGFNDAAKTIYCATSEDGEVPITVQVIHAIAGRVRFPNTYARNLRNFDRVVSILSL